MNKMIFFFVSITSITLSGQDTNMVNTANGTFPLIDQGAGTPIILLHGFPDSKEIWKYQLPVLVNAGYRVIAPDLRGYGKAPSPLGKEEYTIPILMSDVIGILDALEIDQAHLVGHDWGAALSWQLATFYPHRFTSLIALSVGYPGNSAWSSIEQHQKSWYFYLFLQEGLAEKTLADYDYELTRTFMSSHPELDQVIKRYKEELTLTTALNWYRGNMQNRLSQPNVDYQPATEKPPIPKEKVAIPVLGIWSDGDIYLSEAQMKQSIERATNFSFQKVEGAGHWMMLDRPDEVNELFLSFFNEQSK